jgi:hypothetical protein
MQFCNILRGYDVEICIWEGVYGVISDAQQLRNMRSWPVASVFSLICNSLVLSVV